MHQTAEIGGGTGEGVGLRTLQRRADGLCVVAVGDGGVVGLYKSVTIDVVILVLGEWDIGIRGIERIGDTDGVFVAPAHESAAKTRIVGSQQSTGEGTARDAERTVLPCHNTSVKAEPLGVFIVNDCGNMTVGNRRRTVTI